MEQEREVQEGGSGPSAVDKGPLELEGQWQGATGWIGERERVLEVARVSAGGDEGDSAEAKHHSQTWYEWPIKQIKVGKIDTASRICVGQEELNLIEVYSSFQETTTGDAGRHVSLDQHGRKIPGARRAEAHSPFDVGTGGGAWV